MAFEQSVNKSIGSRMVSEPRAAPRRRGGYRPKLPLSILTAIVLVLGLQFVIIPRYMYQQTSSEVKLSRYHLDRLDAKLQTCAKHQQPPVEYPVTTAGSRRNLRWNPITGQNETIVLRNATLFDGETILGLAVDIVFKKGIIESISSSGSLNLEKDAKVYELHRGYVTPGLVDMHSHHVSNSWPSLPSDTEGNEVNPELGPITSQVRIIDSMNAWDPATEVIASGGVTTSLILPGSANIMGGEAILIKNALKSGADAEFNVEDILFEHGIPEAERRRFMKMACGENPSRVYRHTRMGNAWYFRKHMERAKELMEREDASCLEAAVLKESGHLARISTFLDISPKDSATDYLEYGSSIAMLRGQVGVNIHCYETEDFYDMIKHSKEFGFRIQAFHHALEAWMVPEMIKESGENITIATFADFGLYKKEAYHANLWAGKILAEHGVPVAYKSDHVEAGTNAKYLLFQAATAHSFHLSEDLSLQSVTSVPATSLGISHRVGYARPGYDADLVVWDSHPLSAGATAKQVYVDGKAILDPAKVSESLAHVVPNPSTDMKKLLGMRKVANKEDREELCSVVQKPGATIVITGITESFLDHNPTAYRAKTSEPQNLTLIISSGKITCLDHPSICNPLIASSLDSPLHTLTLTSGYISPGLTTLTAGLGLSEIWAEPSTSDGSIPASFSLSPEDVIYAKYGLHLEGKAFDRARIGGVMRAVTAPRSEGFGGGVSVGFKTKEGGTVLGGGVFREEVALHFRVGQDSKAEKLPSVSAAIGKLRDIISSNAGKDNIYGRAANGSLPLVVSAENEYDVMQLIKIKEDYPILNLVIYGGGGAHLVATELASAKIPLLLTALHDAPDTFQKAHTLPGPPLSPSPATILSLAGVNYALCIPSTEGDSRIYSLPVLAGIAGKYAGLSGKDAMDLVGRKVEMILGLDKGENGGGMGDFVVWEGNPLELGASVVLGFDGETGDVGMCWPEAV